MDTADQSDLTLLFLCWQELRRWRAQTLRRKEGKSSPVTEWYFRFRIFKLDSGVVVFISHRLTHQLWLTSFDSSLLMSSCQSAPHFAFWFQLFQGRSQSGEQGLRNGQLGRRVEYLCEVDAGRKSPESDPLWLWKERRDPLCGKTALEQNGFKSNSGSIFLGKYNTGNLLDELGSQRDKDVLIPPSVTGLEEALTRYRLQVWRRCVWETPQSSHEAPTENDWSQFTWSPWQWGQSTDNFLVWKH